MKRVLRPGVFASILVVAPLVVVGLRRPADEAPDRVRVVIASDTSVPTVGMASRREITTQRLPTITSVEVTPVVATIEQARAVPAPVNTAALAATTTSIAEIAAVPTPADDPPVVVMERWVVGTLPELHVVDPTVVEQVRSAVHDAWAHHVVSLRSPDDAALHQRALEDRSGFALSVAEAQWAEYRGLSLYAQAALSVPSTLTVNSVSALDVDHVVARYCLIDSEVIMERGGDPRGGDSFHNTAVAREEGRFGLIRSDDRWVVDDVHVTDRRILHPQSPSEIPSC